MDTLLSFFSHFFRGLGPDEYIHTRSFDRETGGIDQQWLESPEAVRDFATALAPHDGSYDAYFGVSSRRAEGSKKADVVRLYALWADVDFKYFRTDEEAARTLAGFELPPSYTVRSGGGIQAYWLLADPLPATPATVAQAEALMLRLYQRLGGLDKVQDVSRIMRVPGTRNQKYPDKPVVALDIQEPSRRYTLEQFEAVLPHLDTDRAALPGAESSYLPPKEAEVRAMLAALPKEGWDYRDYLSILMAVHSIFPDQRGVRLIQGWSPALDKLTGEDITAEKFASFRSGGVTAGTLVKLAQEHGWVPKRGPKLVLVGQPSPPPTAGDGVDHLAPWRPLLDGFPALERDEMPHYLGLALDYAAPLTTPFPTDWSEMLFLTFFSSQFQRLRFENLSPGLWFLGIAGQGVGKSVGVDEWQRVFGDINLVRELDMPLFTSGTSRGMGNRVAGEDKALLAVFDEYSAFAKSMTMDHSSNIKELMNSLYDGRGFAHNLAGEVIAGSNPFLVSVGVTTPQAFRSSVKTDDMLDGYMSRMYLCAVDTEDHLPGRRLPQERAALVDTLLPHIQGLGHLREARWDTLAGETPRPLREYMAYLGMNTGKTRSLDQELGLDFSLPAGRLVARVKKVATLLALLDEEPQVEGDTLYVHERHCALAVRLVQRGAAYHQRALGWLNFTRDEEADRKVTDMLRRLKQASARTLQQRCHLSSESVKKALEALYHDGRVDTVEVGGNRKKGKSTEYYLIGG